MTPSFSAQSWPTRATRLSAIDRNLALLAAKGDIAGTRQAMFRRDGAVAFRLLRTVYGRLDEVILLQGPNGGRSILVFANGVGVLAGDGSAFPLLTFGYVGAGPRLFSRFLAEAGFARNNATEFQAPVILRRDACALRGAREAGLIRWANGMRMVIPRFSLVP